MEIRREGKLEGGILKDVLDDSPQMRTIALKKQNNFP